MEQYEEKLIELVKENKELYDLSNKSYKNVLKKEKIWKEIAQKLNCDPEKCKRRWKGLRDTFKRNKKLCVLPSGSGAPEAEIRWKYYNHLTFLTDCEGYRRTIGNVSPSSSVREAGHDYEESVVIEDDVDTLYELGPSDSASSFTESPSATEIQKSRTSKSKHPLPTELQELFSSASDIVKAMGAGNQETPTVTLFVALARKIDEAKLSVARRLELEAKVVSLVYETLLPY